MLYHEKERMLLERELLIIGMPMDQAQMGTQPNLVFFGQIWQWIDKFWIFKILIQVWGDSSFGWA